MEKHVYSAKVQWTGNEGRGTSGYRDYNRNHEGIMEGKPNLLLTSEKVYRGNPERHCPEDLLLTALSSCHMLWYLHLCADAGIVVTAYEDQATGSRKSDVSDNGSFIEVVLNPIVTIQDVSRKDLAFELHKKAKEKCAIANSCNFPVHHQPIIKTEQNG